MKNRVEHGIRENVHWGVGFWIISVWTLNLATLALILQKKWTFLNRQKNIYRSFSADVLRSNHFCQAEPDPLPGTFRACESLLAELASIWFAFRYALCSTTFHLAMRSTVCKYPLFISRRPWHDLVKVSETGQWCNVTTVSNPSSTLKLPCTAARLPLPGYSLHTGQAHY